MQGMFNGAAVVTRECAPFVEVLKRVRFFGLCLATEMLRNAEICLMWATLRIYKRGEQFLGAVRPVVRDI
jgi:hypothetical protein